MAYKDIATVQISLDTAGLTAQGFGTPLFASAHRYFPERVRAYTSLTAAADDLPTDSSAYKAVQGYLSNTPSPSVVKIGRQEADLDLTVAVGSTAASLTFEATDGTNSYSLSIDVSGEADEDAVATAIASAIEGDGDIGPLVDATASTNTVTVSPTGAEDAFWISNLSEELTESYTTSETAPNLISAISDEDDDYYFFSAEDHTETFVLAAAGDIEARTKIYFVSVAEQSALTAYSAGAATDILGKLADSGYFRTASFFHHQADTEFPETNYVGKRAWEQAGATNWTNLQLSLTASQDPSTGKVLSATQKGYLDDRNAAYVEIQNAQLSVLRGGRVASGEKVDTIRGRDALTEDLTIAYKNQFIDADTPFNNAGIAEQKGTCRSVLDRYVSIDFINDNYEVDFPNIGFVSDSDKQAGIYRLGTFKAELTGSIDIVEITGSLVITL